MATKERPDKPNKPNKELIMRLYYGNQDSYGK